MTPLTDEEQADQDLAMTWANETIPSWRNVYDLIRRIRAEAAAENTRLLLLLEAEGLPRDMEHAIAERDDARAENTRLRESVERFRGLWSEVREHARLAKEALAIVDGKASQPLRRVTGWLGATLAHVENIETALTDYEPTSDNTANRKTRQAP